MRLTLLKSLVIFFVGFMTAIYVVAPDPHTETMRAEVLMSKANDYTKQFVSPEYIKQTISTIIAKVQPHRVVKKSCYGSVDNNL